MQTVFFVLYVNFKTLFSLSVTALRPIVRVFTVQTRSIQQKNENHSILIKLTNRFKETFT